MQTYTAQEYSKLGISNDFMFGRIMQDAALCKPLLEQILNMKIDHITYLERQKVIDEKADARSIRLDIYAEDGKAVYDCEMQTTKNRELPKRTRYYQGQIDMHLIQKGESYTKLKKSFVIFICTYDPYKEGQYIYTFENMCREVDRLRLNDDAIKIFLNTKGTKGNVSEEFKKLMSYIDTSVLNAENESELTKKLDAALTEARSNEKWGHDFMTWEMMKNECREEGREAGRREGREAGRREGREVGRQEGKTSALRETIARMTKRGMNIEDIADCVGISCEEVKKIQEDAMKTY